MSILFTNEEVIRELSPIIKALDDVSAKLSRIYPYLPLDIKTKIENEADNGPDYINVEHWANIFKSVVETYEARYDAETEIDNMLQSTHDVSDASPL